MSERIFRQILRRNANGLDDVPTNVAMSKPRVQIRRLLPAQPIIVGLHVQMQCRLHRKALRIFNIFDFPPQQQLRRDGAAPNEAGSQCYHNFQYNTTERSPDVRWK